MQGSVVTSLYQALSPNFRSAHVVIRFQVQPTDLSVGEALASSKTLLSFAAKAAAFFRRLIRMLNKAKSPRLKPQTVRRTLGRG
jgi:hypothetical protein